MDKIPPILLTNIDTLDAVFQFLAGTFHQDTFYEDALKELLEETHKEYLQDAIVFLSEFLKNDYSSEEKQKYIRYSADGIYFEGLEITPLEWLENIVEILKQTVRVY
ncbi:contact-dependent growth inhibition system immunity protein [Bacillus wiedmannii]|uniref:contact-dependent growth inhibition system immunity protein n=1 Tax=Bacillus wiedmannii TaxID=1890302 RepID=UPI000868F189|nr:contact-dependent growth inhibition system immunity protein [Bacillus wiedmannii]MDM5268234.1 contact-dependent growth inhibition system immunity protein [Bacillus wiedmannii]MEE3946754.1 contact-dependent growth inhibition system immunity protein [Bacillus wiedmannii]PFZ86780.1 hypothetical protein COL83_27590 [Bacillus wiedmannii]SCN36323.1 Uncharacterized protein BCRIVMBC938_03379 [Bacillus wiedmannii]